MGRLIYIANTTLDGYTADRDGDFGFTVPTTDVFTAITDVVRPIGTYLYGRRMYETMAVWDTAHLEPDSAPYIPGNRDLEVEFANLWRAADKLVFSTTLQAPTTARTRLERAFDPDAVRRLKAASDCDLSVGGPHIAAQMLAAGLVDELHAFVSPIILGGGNAWLPSDVRIPLELVGERRMGRVVHLHYATS